MLLPGALKPQILINGHIKECIKPMLLHWLPELIFRLIYILFSHTIMLHHKWLDIVPSATQQDLTANPFQRQFASTNAKLPNYPTPSPSPLATTRLFSKSMIFFSVERFICAIY